MHVPPRLNLMMPTEAFPMVDETPTATPVMAEPEPPSPAADRPDDVAGPPDAEGAPGPADSPAAQEPPAPPPDEPPAAPPTTEGAGEPVQDNKKWYVVKVQSGREESIKEAIERRVKIEGLEEFFDQILIPTEKETIMRNNKRVIRERKLFPGYLMARVEFNDRILYLFRETSGVGDFVGAGLNHPPQPMKDHEVEKMLHKVGKEVTGEIKVQKPRFERGDRVKVKDGVFAGMEGEVKDLLEAKGLVRVELTVLGRPVPVELEYWQVEPV
jgi:transcriptional antiterminator NusG